MVSYFYLLSSTILSHNIIAIGYIQDVYITGSGAVRNITCVMADNDINAGCRVCIDNSNCQYYPPQGPQGSDPPFGQYVISSPGTLTIQSAINSSYVLDSCDFTSTLVDTIIHTSTSTSGPSSVGETCTFDYILHTIKFYLQIYCLQICIVCLPCLFLVHYHLVMM